MDALEFNVSQLLRADIGARHSYVLRTDEPLDLEGVVAQHIIGDVQLMRTNFGILAQADVDAVLDLTCSRCLEGYPAPVHTHFDEEFLPVVDVTSGLPVQSDRAEEAFAITPNHIVDLTEAVRQHLLLAAPMLPVCREDCRGLCPTCGQNRNDSACGCDEDDAPHPFAALAALLDDDANDH